jgi:site-specific DNA-adenine methylase
MVLTTKKKIEKFNELGLNEKINNFIIDTQVVRGCLSNNKNVDDMGEELKLISKINFSNVDAFELIDKFKTDKDAFIFLDPPYLFSNNATYQTQQEQQDMTDYYAKFYDVLKDKKTKAKIMLIINDLKILRWIYKDFLKGDYNRIYQASKKKMKHLIITNYQV